MEGTIGEIRMFGGNFAPRGWALCEGQLLAISSNQALFSILGTTYGGDGKTTFGLPDLRGRFPLQPGTGPGLRTHRLGEKGGHETTTLTNANLPAHTHEVTPMCSAGLGDQTKPVSNVPAVVKAGDGNALGAYAAKGTDTMAPITSKASGGGQSFDNLPPYIGIHFIICLVGIYPSRN